MNVCHDSTAALSRLQFLRVVSHSVGAVDSKNLGRLLQSVSRGVTRWLRTGAVRTYAVMRSVCYACVSYG